MSFPTEFTAPLFPEAPFAIHARGGDGLVLCTAARLANGDWRLTPTAPEPGEYTFRITHCTKPRGKVTAHGSRGGAHEVRVHQKHHFLRTPSGEPVFTLTLGAGARWLFGDGVVPSTNVSVRALRWSEVEEPNKGRCGTLWVRSR